MGQHRQHPAARPGPTPEENLTDRDRPEAACTLALLVLTVATGAIDGVSYLALDRVFTGNMTGNVLLIGFGLVGVPGIPVLNDLVALLTFLLGAAVGWRAARARRGRGASPPWWPWASARSRRPP